LRVLYPRVAKAQLLHRDIMGPRPPRSRTRRVAGVAIVVTGTIAAFGAGYLIASGRWHPAWAPARVGSGAGEMGIGLMPFLAVVALGCALL
jgi:hypothetical protein